MIVISFCVLQTAAVAQATVNLGTAADFGVLASAAITGTSTVTGNVGTTDALAAIAGTITVTGVYTKYNPTVPADQAIVNAAHDDLALAYSDAATRGGASVLSAAAYDFAGATLGPGVYSIGTSAAMTTSMTLDGAGIYIFQIGTTLGTTAGVAVNLVNGAVWSNIFWQVGGAVTIAGTTTFEGTILGHDAITVGAGATVNGGLLAGAVAAGAVTDNASTVVVPVELVAFTASANRMNADLHWSTATEVDNYGFEIERRQTAQWGKVGFVPGAGTSSSPRDYSFTDENISPGRYAYRIKQVDKDGSFSYFGSAEVEIGLASKKFELGTNYPNPFNPVTTIQFTLDEDGWTSLNVYNMLGQQVMTLFDGNAQAGRLYQAKFDASKLPSGLYFAKLESGNQHMVQKMVLMK